VKTQPPFHFRGVTLATGETFAPSHPNGKSRRLLHV
jgi:hypothetical protein